MGCISVLQMQLLNAVEGVVVPVKSSCFMLCSCKPGKPFEAKHGGRFLEGLLCTERRDHEMSTRYCQLAERNESLRGFGGVRV